MQFLNSVLQEKITWNTGGTNTDFKTNGTSFFLSSGPALIQFWKVPKSPTFSQDLHNIVNNNYYQ